MPDAPPTTGDVDLTGTAPPPPPSNGGGVNAPHPDDPEAAAALAEETRLEEEAAEQVDRDMQAEAAKEEEGEVQWPEDEQPAESVAPPSSDGQADVPAPETPTEPTEPEPSAAPSAPEPPTGEDDGDDPEPDPPDPEPASRSGAAKRPYTVLEEQEVVPFHLLTEAQQKSAGKHKQVGFIPRGEKVVARNMEAALQETYPEGADEHVSRVLPLSERSFQPANLDVEPVRKSRLRIRR